ncbi:MAG: NifU family protein [Elusimicrobia bacterium]|nr:NifU family protein [Elusimicrobiota bacterium]
MLTTRLASNLVTCRFELDKPLAEGAFWFGDAAMAKDSPLASAVFGVDTVVGVKINGPVLSVTRDSYDDWPVITKQVAELLKKHAASGKAAVAPGTPTNLPTTAQIREKAAHVLETEINPAVASHGGEIILVDVKDATVFVRLTGGCQGCASSTATLKQGVERSLREAIPQLDEIKDVTDHDAGENPYYKG